MMRRLFAAISLLGALVAGCARPTDTPQQIDLIAATEEWLRLPAGPNRASGPAGDRVEVEFVDIADDLRRCLRATGEDTYLRRLTIPAEARFRVAFGIEDSDRNDPDSALTVAVQIQTRAGTDTLSRRRLDPSEPEHRRWYGVDVSLEAYADQQATLVLETRPARADQRPLGAHACWANPTVYVNAREDAGGTPPDIFILSIDTLRPDHLGAYGYSRPTSPNIDALAADGILFENVFTTIPRTSPALASLMTGNYPRTHGVMTLRHSLSSDQQTLADLLKQHGYATGAVVTSNISRQSGLNQGFDTFSDRARVVGKSNNRGSVLVEEAIDWVTERRHLKKFFWLHLLEPHFPYTPPEPQKQKFANRYGEGFDLYDRVLRGAVKIGQIYFQNDLSPTHVRHMSDLYDGEIHRADELIGIFLEHLKDLGLYENALIVLTADHGESLGEHDYYFEHGEYLYDPELRIPLIIRFPTRRTPALPHRGRVSILDIAPTVLATIGIDTPEMRGRDLRPLLGGDGDSHERYFAETGHRFFKENPRRYVPGIEGNWKSVRDRGWKLIEIPTANEPIYELYDMANDPVESGNVYSENPEVAARLRGALRSWMAGFESEEKGVDVVPPISDEMAEQLRALGYMD